MSERLDLSVVLTTYNRRDLLAQTLESMTRLATGALRYEILVVDNASTDDTAEVLRRYAERLPLRALYEARQGYAFAKNHGLDRARGELVVFTDDDVIVAPDWLTALWQASRDWPRAGIFGGRVQPLLPDRLPRWLRSPAMQNAMQRRFGYFYPRAEAGPVSMAPVGANMAVRRSSMGATRLDTGRGADGSANYLQSAERDFIQRLIDAGESVVFVPAAYVDHVVRLEQLTLAGLNARAFRRGRKNALVERDRYNAGLRIAGAPVKLWSRVAGSTLRCWLLRPFGQRLRYPVENRAAFRRGFLYQRRLEAQTAARETGEAQHSDRAPR